MDWNEEIWNPTLKQALCMLVSVGCHVLHHIKYSQHELLLILYSALTMKMHVHCSCSLGPSVLNQLLSGSRPWASWVHTWKITSPDQRPNMRMGLLTTVHTPLLITVNMQTRWEVHGVHALCCSDIYTPPQQRNAARCFFLPPGNINSLVEQLDHGCKCLLCVARHISHLCPSSVYSNMYIYSCGEQEIACHYCYVYVSLWVLNDICAHVLSVVKICHLEIDANINNWLL